MTKDKALKLALEALKEYCEHGAIFMPITAVEAIEQALAAPVQDSTCRETLRAQGKAYPRTCKKCGKGPCIGAPKQPPAQPAVPDALTSADIQEHIEYVTGWNDCRQAMLEMMK
jgi:cytochrome c5